MTWPWYAAGRSAGALYPVHEAGGTYSQYLVAPWKCATRLRRADVLIDVSNGVPFFSPLWRRSPSVCLALHYHGDQWATRFARPLAARPASSSGACVPMAYRRRRFVAISAVDGGASFGALGVGPTHITVIEPGVDAAAGPATADLGRPTLRRPQSSRPPQASRLPPRGLAPGPARDRWALGGHRRRARIQSAPPMAAGSPASSTAAISAPMRKPELLG